LCLAGTEAGAPLPEKTVGNAGRSAKPGKSNEEKFAHIYAISNHSHLICWYASITTPSRELPDQRVEHHPPLPRAASTAHTPAYAAHQQQRVDGEYARTGNRACRQPLSPAPNFTRQVDLDQIGVRCTTPCNRQKKEDLQGLFLLASLAALENQFRAPNDGARSSPCQTSPPRVTRSDSAQAPP